MLHNQAWISGFESPTDIENHVENLIGPDAAEDFWMLYRANYVAQADIDQIADWGFNHIRVPFHYKQFYILSLNLKSFLLTPQFQLLTLIFLRQFSLHQN